MKISFILNGSSVAMEVSPKKRLLDVLREDFGLIGTKEGCGRGECGSCTILLNGRRVNSCLVPAMQIEGSRVTTIEGVREWPVFDRIAQAFIDHGSVQCGLCIPGYVMSAVAVLDEVNSTPTESELQAALAGNLCRCTGYDKIMNAVTELAADPDLRGCIQEALNHERS